MPSFGLQLRASSPRGSFERWYERPPVFIGRRPSSDCVLDGRGVSKTHACIDVRAQAICVRDCGSANGTIVAGSLVEPHRWVRAGAPGEPVEIQISDWTLHLAALPVSDAPPESLGRATLVDFFRPQSTRSLPGVSPPIPPERTVALDAPATAILQAPSFTALDALYAEHLRIDRALYETAANILAEEPATRVRFLCDQLVATYPLLGREPQFVALLRHYGWSSSPAPQGGTPLAQSALDKVQELARWYLGQDRAVTSEAELTAFKERQRRALDELLIGFVRLVAGLDKFEQEMALRRESSTAPRSPEALIRQLLDWRLPADEALEHVRRSFADLMMHQVGLLHGVMRGVKALLTELSPAKIEAIAKERRGKRVLPFGGPDPWSVYAERHSDFSDEENERFRVLFGADFADEYRLVTGERQALPGRPGVGSNATGTELIDRKPGR